MENTNFLNNPQLSNRHLIPAHKGILVFGVVITVVLLGFYAYATYLAKVAYDKVAEEARKAENLVPRDSSTIEQSDISTWKTYTNTEYGFEFKYPDQGKIVEESNGYIRLDHYLSKEEKEFFDRGEFFLEIIWGNDTYLPNRARDEYRIYNIDGHSAYSGIRFDDSINLFPGYDTYILKDSEVFILAASLNSGDEEAKSLINQILSTFKFIEGDAPQVSPAPVKTPILLNYVNSKHGYQIQYTPDLKFGFGDPNSDFKSVSSRNITNYFQAGYWILVSTTAIDHMKDPMENISFSILKPDTALTLNQLLSSFDVFYEGDKKEWLKIDGLDALKVTNKYTYPNGYVGVNFYIKDTDRLYHFSYYNPDLTVIPLSFNRIK